MIYIPFLYFLLLMFLMLYIQKSINVGTCVVGLYVFSSFFAILADYNNLYNDYGINPKTEIEFSTVFIYCISLTITILPFYFFRSDKIREIVCIKPRFFNYISYFFMFVFIITLIDSLENIQRVLLVGDLGEVRGQFYGTMLDKRQGPTFLGYFAYLFAGYAPVMLLFYFYSITFLKKRKWFNIAIFVSSLTLVLTSILQAGRFAVIYWLMMFILIFVLFRPLMNRKVKIQILKPFFVFGSIIILYMAAVTIARFDERGDTNSFNSLIGYIGQPFLNFSYIFQNYNSDHFVLGRILPFTNHYLLGDDYVQWEYIFTEMSRSGIFLNVFYTFIGEIYVDFGILGMFLYVSIFFIFTSICLKRRESKVINLGQLIILIAIIRIPYQGLFAIVYPYVTDTYYLWGSFLLYFLFRYRIVYK